MWLEISLFALLVLTGIGIACWLARGGQVRENLLGPTVNSASLPPSLPAASRPRLYRGEP